ncbi:M64 family metallopeptidase [uncultured Algibacter sp.]|uniref:T9SS type A sorting domain-containing protein n=1 Tax=uncultured Algibacter sp. TaxID=298659 RepID=UPI00263461A6|nr:M64 family metallopeptidase [uncultured Algibacter sp.]
MKFTLLVFLTFQIVSAQVFDKENIKVSGDDNKRINLVILSEGYQATEFSKFIEDATIFSNALFSQSPFKEYADYFNVYALKVPSVESGTDHPATATDVTEPVFPQASTDTYFDSSFDSSGVHRLLYTYNSSAIYSVLANNIPEYDQAIILVNTSEYGGGGGAYAVASTGNYADELAIHELGHSLFDLNDEYYPGDTRARESINMTQETSPSAVRWKNWINDNGVGVYPYGSIGSAATWNRPHQRCKMRYLGDPFCSVCKEGIIEKIHSLVSPINSFIPDNTTIETPTFPLDFELDLIKTIPNTLENSWTLNTQEIANNVDNVSLVENDLLEGTNILTTSIEDKTTALRIDNHYNIHIYTITWTINYDVLSVLDIESEVNNFFISLYPNPSNTVVNLKVESDYNENIKVDIVALDGKKLKSVSLLNFQTNQIDISDLSTGVYLTNIYSGNRLISSERLVKN